MPDPRTNKLLLLLVVGLLLFGKRLMEIFTNVSSQFWNYVSDLVSYLAANPLATLLLILILIFLFVKRNY